MAPSRSRRGRALPDGITFQWERLSTIARELPPLFKLHWAELALNKEAIPLEPDWDRYFHYEAAGILYILTVRSDTVLIGYAFTLVGPHLHYASTLWGHTEMFWLQPDFRRGTLGIRLIRAVEDGMRAIGVKVHHFPVKLHFLSDRGTIGRLFERLGYKPIETVYGKRLE